MGDAVAGGSAASNAPDKRQQSCTAQVNVYKSLRDYAKQKQQELIDEIHQLLTEGIDSTATLAYRQNLVKITDECLDFHRQMTNLVQSADDVQWIDELKGDARDCLLCCKTGKEDFWQR